MVLFTVGNTVRLSGTWLDATARTGDHDRSSIRTTPTPESDAESSAALAIYTQRF